MMTLAAGAIVRMSAKIANPSEAPCRVLAGYTLWSEKAQRSWRRRPGSSSTISNGLSIVDISSGHHGRCRRLSLGHKGQEDPHGGTNTSLGDYFEVTARHADQLSGLKGADAITARFRRAER